MLKVKITQNYLGTYRVYRFDDMYYIYVQRYGYNIILKDTKHHNYNLAFIIARICSFFDYIYIFYEI